MTMGGGGVIVPTSVRSEPEIIASSSQPVVDDKDLLCPICMQIIKDAFLTSCGHNFCYICIATHLQNKTDCPSCSHYLTSNHLFPNFLLNKVHSLFHFMYSVKPIQILILHR